MTLQQFLTLTAQLPLTLWVTVLASLLSFGYGGWVIAFTKSDCAKIFSVFAMVCASMFFLLTWAELTAVESITDKGLVAPKLYSGYSSLAQLYDLFSAVINLLAIKVIHDAHK